MLADALRLGGGDSALIEKQKMRGVLGERRAEPRDFSSGRLYQLTAVQP